MPNVFLEGLQRPAILQNNSGLPDYSEANDGDVLQIASGEPTWGAVDALPEIEETDEGKVLAVDQGEAVWADAPSGLPEFTNSDEGKVLTVVAQTEEVAFIPEQSVTLEPTGEGSATYTGALANVTLTPSDFSEGDLATFAIGENSVVLAYSTAAVASIPGFLDEINGFAILYDASEWKIIAEESGTVTISATRSIPASPTAEWVQQNPYDFEITFTFNESTGTITASKTYAELLALMPGLFGGWRAKVTTKTGGFSNTEIMPVTKTAGTVTFVFWPSFQLSYANGWASTPPYLSSFLSRFVIASDDSVTYDERNIQIEYTVVT